ncbi:hypothetical protein DFS34DRAFT_324203 [Phlyctochytrium arcticum]|nr:hypothetical protein DFS34DRAFT_324203 [Phlyctochytrium arcticum]
MDGCHCSSCAYCNRGHGHENPIRALSSHHPKLKILHLVQKEIGQIMDFLFIASESHESMRISLDRVKKNLEEGGHAPTVEHALLVVTDNIDNNKSLITGMGPGYIAKQDSFHVIQRITQKIKTPARFRVQTELHNALYLPKVDKRRAEHRNPEEAAVLFQAACDRVDVSGLGEAALKEWNGSVTNNVKLIRDGYVFAGESNTGLENGVEYSKLHTSGVESTNACLKVLTLRGLGYALAMRILIVFIVKQNLRCGGKFGRWPDLHHMDILTLIKLTMTCRDRMPATPQTAFALQIIHKLRSNVSLEDVWATDPKQFIGTEWSCFMSIFEASDPNHPPVLALHGTPARSPLDPPTIRSMFHTTSARSKTLPPRERTTTAQFLQFLAIHPSDITQPHFNNAEYRLLIKVICTQQSPTADSEDELQNCPLVLKLLYSCAMCKVRQEAVEARGVLPSRRIPHTTGKQNILMFVTILYVRKSRQVLSS